MKSLEIKSYSDKFDVHGNKLSIKTTVGPLPECSTAELEVIEYNIAQRIRKALEEMNIDLILKEERETKK